MKEPLKVAPETERTPWPPTDYLYKQPVTLADNWWTLRDQYRPGGDPWDIIQYNFDTTDPNIVNWYLYHRVGCRVVKADGKNYRFGTHDPTKTLYIYIPYPDWKPPVPQDRKARSAVLWTLFDPLAVKVSFSVRGFSLVGHQFARVGRLVKNSRIRVQHDPALPTDAAYLPNDTAREAGNVFKLNFFSSPTLSHRAVIIHEAVHAVMDVHRVRVSLAQSEGIAYIAQCLYAQLRGMATRQIREANAQNDQILAISWAIAERLRDGRPTTESDLRDLGRAIRASPLYKGRGDPLFDGVP